MCLKKKINSILDFLLHWQKNILVYLITFINVLTLCLTFVALEHKSSVKSLGYICSNNQKYIVWVKIIDFSFMPKIIRILRSCSMNIFSKFPTVNISKRFD